MEEISPVFRESASLDRFHGFIPGWELPRMHQGLVANGWALNTEYFAEVLHLMRDDLSYSTIVDECLLLPPKPDQRDLTAIKRLCTAFMKLIFPNATCKSDISPEDFIQYCLEPAKEMRSVIKKQLCIIDPKEFNVRAKRIFLIFSTDIEVATLAKNVYADNAATTKLDTEALRR